MKPCYETDVNKLLAAKEILFRDNQSDGAWEPVTIAKCCYGGARIDYAEGIPGSMKLWLTESGYEVKSGD